MVLVLVVVLVVGELLDGAAPAVAAEGPSGEVIQAAREEEESSERYRRRPAEWAREWDEEDAQPAPQEAAHAKVGWLAGLYCCGGAGMAGGGVVGRRRRLGSLRSSLGWSLCDPRGCLTGP